jgi:hypothetical protein
MGSDEEQKRIELVIREQIKATEEKVEEKVEKIVESTGIDTSSVKPIISEVTAATTTVITPVAAGIKELTQAMGLSSISESSLTDEQKKLATQIYDSTKAAIQGFINDASLNNTVKITKTLGQVIKQLEGVKVDGKGPSGADKKAVAIQLGRILIKEVMPDDKGEAEVLVMYDLVAEPTLEAMIEVSRVVNVAVQELATKCCPGLFEFFKRVKKTA